MSEDLIEFHWQVSDAGYKWIKKQNSMVAARRKAAQRADGPRNLGDLVWDESAGAYRPRQDS